MRSWQGSAVAWCSQMPGPVKQITFQYHYKASTFGQKIVGSLVAPTCILI